MFVLLRVLVVITSGLLCSAVAGENLAKNFGMLPRESLVSLSPAAKRIASIWGHEGQQFLMMREVGNPGASKPIYKINDDYSRIRWLEWANDDRLLLSVIAPSSRFGVDTVETRLMAMDHDGGNVINVVKLRNTDRFPQFQDRVVDFLPDDPDHILLSLDKKIALRPSVYKVNINTASAKLVQRSRPQTRRWMSDRQHRIRLRVESDGGVFQVHIKDHDTKKWWLLAEYEGLSDQLVRPIGFGQDPNELYFLAYQDDYLAVFKTDLSTQSFSPEIVFQTPGEDVEGELWYSSKSQQVVGIVDASTGAYQIWHPTYLAFQKGLDKALPDTSNYMLGMSQDETRYILLATSATLPGTLLFGDRAAGSLQPFAWRYPQLDHVELVEKQWISYETRDGATIRGYLSVPPETEGPNALVVLPHGGPISESGSGFDYWVQFLVSLGYSVIEMDFRGSDGYGFSHMEAGLGNWGTRIHNDITDATRWAISEDIADPDKICIVGASFGGYAALMGVAMEPELYRCAVAFAPVTDLNRLLSESRRYANSEMEEKQIGTDRKRLRATSPRRLADQVEAPVLLMHGEDDRVVDVKHSQIMHTALQKAKKSVKYVEFESGNHHLSRERNRQMALEEIQEFLQAHL